MVGALLTVPRDRTARLVRPRPARELPGPQGLRLRGTLALHRRPAGRALCASPADRQPDGRAAPVGDGPVRTGPDGDRRSRRRRGAAETSVLHYTPFDLDGPRHPHQLTRRDETILLVNHRQTGVGGINSWERPRWSRTCCTPAGPTPTPTGCARRPPDREPREAVRSRGRRPGPDGSGQRFAQLHAAQRRRRRLPVADVEGGVGELLDALVAGRRARAKTSSADRPTGARQATGASGAYVAVTAADAVHAARRLGIHRVRGSAGRVRSTALGVVAAWTSVIASPWPPPGARPPAPRASRRP